MEILVLYGGENMIKYFGGTVFNSGAKAIVNTVNTVGVMGAGIALEFKLRYPDMYLNYVNKCEEKLLKVGIVDYYQDKSGIIIINFPTKVHFKYPSKLIWIERGLQNFIETYKEYNIKSIAFPKLGASRGGLEWYMVKDVMEKYLSNLDIEIVICLDENEKAEGHEKEMLEKLNEIDIDILTRKIKLSKKQAERIKDARPLKRFWRLRQLESIGAKTYEKLFNFFYHDSKDNDNNVFVQQSFLDGDDV